jgi:F0F1-type ATP synthase alpha subunit
MTVEDQIAVIYAVSNGYFNKFAVKEIADAEKTFLEFMNRSKRPLLDKLAKGEWDENVENDLKDACTEFVK